MPKEFTDCVNSGGKVVTKSLGEGKYMHICYDKDGNSYSGEVKKKKKKSKSKQDVIRRAKKRAKANKKLADEASLRELQKHFHEKYHN